MAIVITFASEKGGVAKTNSCINVATCLCMSGYRVLVCDMDPQANSTYMLTGQKKKDGFYRGCGVYDMLRAYGLKKPTEYVQDSHIAENLKVLASNSQTPLAIGQLEMLEKENGESRNRFFMYCLAELDADFDFILCDTSPARDSLTLSAITASDYVVIPCLCNDFSLDGLETTYSLLSKLKGQENTEIRLLGVLLAVVEKYALTDFIREEIRESDYATALFQTEIRKGQAVNDSLTLGKPVVLSAPKSGPGKDYFALTEEILERIRVDKGEPL